MEYLHDIRELYETTIAPFWGQPKGCTDKQITELETRVGFAFPRAYAEFLCWIGQDLCGMFKGSDCFVKHVEDNTRYLPKLLERNHVRFELPLHFLAFFCHQGYQMVWFPLPSQSDDPICWGYCEGQTSEPVTMGTFTEWLRKCTESLGPLIARLHGNDE